MSDGHAERNPEGIVREMLEAAEAGDSGRVLSFLAPDFAVRSWDGTPLVDRAGYGEALAWDLAAGGSKEIERLDVVGDTVSLLVLERNRFTDLLDLGPFRLELRYVVRGGLVAGQRMRERPGGGRATGVERFTRAIAPVLSWAADEAPGLLATATEDGAIVYDGESARALLELVRRYRREQGAS
ncbi:MAG: hypothetical protein PVI57_06055 [Gemmatimonadota bacterium]